MSKLMTAAEAAEMLRISEVTLNTWRRSGKGPVAFRIGARKLFYDRVDIESWIQEQKEATRTESRKALR